MTCRKDVFQSKVLHRLYPATPALEKKPSPPCGQRQSPTNKACPNRKTLKDGPVIENKETAQQAAHSGGRVYTVLPPPADYKAHAEESVNLLTTDSDKDSAEHDGSDEIRPDEAKTRRRKRRKRKTPLPPQAGEGGAAQAGEVLDEEPSGPPEDGAQEGISKNKKRKLKKKRHKDKLRSMGLIPRAAAVEFTYEKVGDEEEGEEDDDDIDRRRATEVSDFLRTAMKLYSADSSLHTNETRIQPGVIDDLAGSVAGGAKPARVLKQLHGLKSLVGRGEADGLEEALRELRSSTSLSAGETAAVVSLFQYWITDVLPTSDGKEADLAEASA